MDYSEKVIDHYTSPRNVGKIDDASGVGEVGNPVCGDIMKMYLKIENDVIVDVKFKTFGCGAAIATSSISTEMVKGKQRRRRGFGRTSARQSSLFAFGGGGDPRSDRRLLQKAGKNDGRGNQRKMQPSPARLRTL